MKTKDLNTPFDQMTADQLQRGINLWLRGGADDASRDESVRKATEKKLAKIAEKRAAKNAPKQQ